MLNALARSNTRGRRQLSEEAANYVRALIVSGELLPGSRVRVEAIAEALGISTTPAREALQELKVEGFLELIPRHGFRVAQLTGKDIEDLFRVQALVAGELVARAAQQATPTQITGLETIHENLQAAAKAGDLTRLEELNHIFHREIYRISDAPKVRWVLGLLTRYVPRIYYSSIEGWPESTIEDHGVILDMIKAADPEGARAAIHEHLGHSGSLLAAHFNERLQA
jgi:DNA-binding GntR family transcriptional regulator